ncbi:hypothetical protein [Chitinibacter sp. ZOR0017]|jgi:hypothetical protein|uniref:hypothetical protein n=2 Tax=Chitinibacter TaxID=230666 RepID=UPI0012E0B9D6|nr:hypothetical protein [Chitinibacter sp. ZOR0017]
MQLSMKMCAVPILLGIACLLGYGVLSSAFDLREISLVLLLLPLGWMLIFGGIYIGLMYLSQMSIDPIRFRPHRHH